MKSFIRFIKGIVIKGETADPTDNIPGSLWHNMTTNRFKTYIETAVREIVTTDQTQTLSNKTLGSDLLPTSSRSSNLGSVAAEYDNVFATKHGVVLGGTDYGGLTTNGTDLKVIAGVVGSSTVLVGNDGTQLSVGSGAINANSVKIINVTDPTNPQEAATKAYVDAHAGGTGFVKADGTVPMTGNLVPNVGSSTINLGTGALHFGTIYGDGLIGDYLECYGINGLFLNSDTEIDLTVTGPVKLQTEPTGTISAENHTINNVADPTSAQDAATKNYVDNFGTSSALSITDGQTATNLTGEVYDGTVYREVDFVACVTRGTTVISRLQFSIFYKNSVWTLVDRGFSGDDPGTTVSLGIQSGSTIQIKLALDTGAGNGTIILKKTFFNA